MPGFSWSDARFFLVRRYQHELLEDFLERMQCYKASIEELERDLASIQDNPPLSTHGT
jgi:hypothetical protein